MDGWRDGWMDGWMDGYIYIYMSNGYEVSIYLSIYIYMQFCYFPVLYIRWKDWITKT